MVNHRKLFLLFMACSHMMALAQQHPHYTMYMANNYILNPALAGIEPYIDLKLAARSQWTGINNAPKTLYATINSPLNITDFKNNRIGIGGKVFVDQTGPILLSSAEFNFAYHLPLNRDYRLSFGVGAGMSYHRIDINNVQLKDPADPIYGMADFNRMDPAISAGLWFYSNDLYVGVAAQNLLENDYSLSTSVSGGADMGLRRHYFATTGYRFSIGDFYVTPSTMLKFVSPAPFAYDLNLKGQFSDMLWAGFTWRHRDGVAAMAGFFISSTLNVAYSYDFVNSDLRRHSQGSHEIILGININNQWGPKCPVIAW
ncbi:PorP/SprF family type IX secretion system membrane protein [Parapedobacter tibetensis]|uniref:PorP/SprF family type IX secretion system membrane protein n=1 Tax=Parapedobacter tibetensis TaxID=2972951 RepID=UPI00214DD920|nr:type IX secretion system membrane protein PorP/SprF [Parapedobacter tibetensis]